MKMNGGYQIGAPRAAAWAGLNIDQVLRAGISGGGARMQACPTRLGAMVASPYSETFHNHMSAPAPQHEH